MYEKQIEDLVDAVCKLQPEMGQLERFFERLYERVDIHEDIKEQINNAHDVGYRKGLHAGWLNGESDTRNAVRENIKKDMELLRTTLEKIQNNINSSVY